MPDPDLTTRDARVFLRQDGSTPCVGALVGADGVWLTDEAGHRLIDLHGNSAHHLGYAHPRLLAAIHRQLETLTFSPRRYANEPATLLAETLTARFRGGDSKLLLATGGSDAMEIAVRLARIATGRHAVIALEGSYHGHGVGSLALSSGRLDARLGPPNPDIHHVTPYWDSAERMLDEIERVSRGAPGGVAALVAEPMRSNCVVPPPDLWPIAASLCARHGAKLIFDEIPSGLGKTGRFFAHEHFGATPDILVLGKALGGGVLPIAAVLADRDLDGAPELSIGHYTHEKNPVTARAALTTIQIIDDEDLTARAAERGAYARKRLAAVGTDLFIGMRGLGLLQAIELRAPVAAALVDAARRNGVSTTAKDSSAVGFSPPLTISEAEIDLALERLVESARGLA